LIFWRVLGPAGEDRNLLIQEPYQRERKLKLRKYLYLGLSANAFAKDSRAVQKGLPDGKLKSGFRRSLEQRGAPQGDEQSNSCFVLLNGTMRKEIPHHSLL
jgi:hypothetical protein